MISAKTKISLFLFLIIMITILGYGCTSDDIDMLIYDQQCKECTQAALTSSPTHTSTDVPLEPTPKPTLPYDPFQVILDYGGFTDKEKRFIIETYNNDPAGDWIYSIAAMIVSNQMEETDIYNFTAMILLFVAEPLEEYFSNTLFPCNEEIEGGFVVCTDDPLPIEPGKVFLVMMKLAAPVPPANPDRFYTYSVVFDADGDDSNNFQFNPPYDWDYYQNTDRWYMLDWTPASGWMLNVFDHHQNLYGYPTAARAVVMDDIVAFFIPASEFSVETPAYRLTTFGHDGSYLPEVSCGDVTGGNPTEPLLKINNAVLSVE